MLPVKMVVELIILIRCKHFTLLTGLQWVLSRVWS